MNPAHPDKIADRIAGAIVDLAYTESANPKIAVEVLIGHGICNIVAESSVHIPVTDIIAAVERIAGKLANILEYGKHGQPAKPFLKPAKSASKNAAIEAMKQQFEKEVKGR